jgi:tetratricopeptide (TPR) repeat protein
MRLKTWHCLSLLALVVLVAYYPALHAGYNSVDDLKMINRISQWGPLEINHIFVRNGSSYYYRPLTILSYALDRDAWGFIASFMHLENILLHLTCAWLVFFITRRLLPLWGAEGCGPSLFAGLLFALHPLATESVCWISGRTDPLMAVFVLLAVWLVAVGMETGSFAASLGAGVALLLGGLAKEVAVFILPGVLWLIIVWPGTGRWLTRLRHRWLPLLTTTVGVVSYFALRNLTIARDTGVKTALKGMSGGDYDLPNKIRVAFKVYGFYFKKLLVPWPLNFGILEISKWYVLAGVVLMVALLYLVWRADVAGAFGLMAFFVLSPALLVVFGKMTWTPLAERYLYTSVALFAPLGTFLTLKLREILTHSNWRSCNIALAALVLIFLGTTLHRAWVWQDNLRLYRDTVAKSPGFAGAKSELASALRRRGDTAEAEEILVGMQGSASPAGFINDDLNLAGVYLSKDDPEGARQILLPLLDQNPKDRFELLQWLIRINDQRLGKTDDSSVKTAILQESLDWLLEQQQIRPSPFILYRVGKKYLALGQEEQALDFFKKAYAQAPRDAFYRGPAATFIRRIEGS